MKRYFKIFQECQRLFRFTSKWQMIKLLFANFILGMWEALGFIPLFLLLTIILDSKKVMAHPYVQPVLSFFSIHSATSATIILSLLVMSFFFLRAIFVIIYVKRMGRLSALWTRIIGQRMFGNYFAAEYGMLLSRTVPHIRNMITFSQSTPNGFFFSLINLTSISIQLIFLALVLVVTLRWAIVFLVIMLAIFLLINDFWIKNIITTVQENIMMRSRKRLFIEENTIVNMRVAKLSDQQDALTEQYNDLLYRDSIDRMRSNVITSVPPMAMELMVIIVLISFFNFLLFSAQDNVILLGQMGVMVGVVFRLWPYVNRIIAERNILKGNHTVMEAIIKEYKEVAKWREVEVQERLPIAFHKKIFFNNVSYYYPKKKKIALKNINLEISKGSFVGITGESGSGKSTLVNLLIGFMTPSKGQVMIDDTPLTRAHMHAWYRKIGLVDQDIFVTTATIAENVAYGEDLKLIKKDKAKEERIIAILRKVQLWQDIANQPKGIYQMVGQGVGQVSGGQAQRLAIARALYRHIELLILDEASSKLDVMTEAKFFNYLKTLKGKMTVVMIAHRLSTLKDCDTIIFMKNGKIKNIGTFRSLQKKDKEFRSYVEHSISL